MKDSSEKNHKYTKCGKRQCDRNKYIPNICICARMQKQAKTFILAGNAEQMNERNKKKNLSYTYKQLKYFAKKHIEKQSKIVIKTLPAYKKYS